MSSLRRDLLERRLWPVVALLVVAVVVVPLKMLKSSAIAGPPVPLPPSTVVTATPAQQAASTVQVKALVSRIPRNPFASGMPQLSSKPASAAAPVQSATSASTVTGVSATSAPSSAVAMVSPAPAASDAGSTTSATAPPTTTVTTAPTASAAATPSAATTTSATTTSATTATSSATTSTTTAQPVATPASVAGAAHPAAVGSWTVYSVAVRFGANTTAPVRDDIARLTPLPSAKTPRVMFMGVMAGGRQAVFALGAGVAHAGPGLCRPGRTDCSAIVLKAGQTEQLAVPAANGATKQLILRVVRISGTVTHSQQVALAAYQRYSAAGLCELDLADPVSYSQLSGTLKSVAATACQGQTAAVPFPSAALAP